MRSSEKGKGFLLSNKFFLFGIVLLTSEAETFLKGKPHLQVYPFLS